MDNYASDKDDYLIKELLVPYLSQVYSGLIARQNKDYLSISKTKQYMNLPELIGHRLILQINANGDERIDHDEFVGFFLKLLMGSLKQKMFIAFKCYDFGNNDSLSKEDVKLLLNNIPFT